MRPVDYARFWPNIDTSGGPQACWLWTGELNRTGYGVFSLWSGRRERQRILAHRAVLKACGVDIDDLVVRHICDNPPCCNPGHLLTGTQRDNIRDAVARGRLDTSGLTIGQRMSTVYKGTPAACGTESGATRHRRRNEPVCDDCRAAVRVKAALRAARRKAGAA